MERPFRDRVSVLRELLLDLSGAIGVTVDQKRRGTMGARAAVVAQRFSIEHCAERFAEIYRGLIEGPAAQP